ncbi:MAG: ferrous iron transport protein B [Peptostreptococcaceae bacterium]|nr:ferrous iron transport protein B [Peptostreptococcaceae bacterium]
MRIALAGNPNSGKTTLYNAITGKNEYVGNWAGVTVAKKEADLKSKYAVKGVDVRIVDLPGAYSISPFTGEEAITRDFILDEKPDVIINIVDGANFSRSLFFTTQLLELNIPVVIALNKGDILDKRGDKVDLSKLSDLLKCSVVVTTATTGEGLHKLIEKAIEIGQAAAGQAAPQIEAGADADRARQAYVDGVIEKSLDRSRDASKTTKSDKIDRIVAHPIWGIPIFALVMWAVYYLSMVSVGQPVTDYINDVLFGEIVPNAANSFLEGLGVSPFLQALIVDGAIAGVGAVLGFLPLIMVLFFCLSLLEDSGYMARVAVIMDKYFKKIGLSGKSIIPMIVGTGCSIPGVMATRTIEDINEKRMTTMLAPFVPCGAKLPIIAMISAAFFPGESWVLPSAFLVSFVVIFFSGLLLKRIFVWENTSHFILELPEYKWPSLKHAVVQMFDKAKGFIKKATSIILVMSTLVWLLTNYTPSFREAEDSKDSMLAIAGSVLEPIMKPLGFEGWELPAASISGFVAKEVVVSTFEVVLGLAEEEEEAAEEEAAPEEAAAPAGEEAAAEEEEPDEFEVATEKMVESGKLRDLFGGPGLMAAIIAYAYLVFNLFTPPCFAAIGAMNSEMESRSWLLKAVAFQLGTGYFLAMLVAQIGTLLLTGQTAPGFVSSIFVFIAFVALIFLLIKRADKKREEMGIED